MELNSVVQANLKIRVQANTTHVPLQLALWLDEELLEADLSEAPQAGQCDGLFLKASATPFNPKRLRTVWVQSNVSTHVLWNVTLVAAGAFHFGISACFQGKVVADGTVSWLRSKGTAGGAGGGSLPSEMLGIVPFCKFPN